MYRAIYAYRATLGKPKTNYRNIMMFHFNLLNKINITAFVSSYGI